MRFVQTSIAIALLASSAASAQPDFANGDLTGTVSSSVVPAPWFLWQKTPDTCDPFGPFNNTPTPWTLSPNGGTFVRTGGDSGVNSEALAQNLTGFTPGQLYTIEFSQTNLGFEHPSTGDWLGMDGFYDVLVDGVVVGSSSVLSKPAINTDAISWSAASVSFSAPAADLEIAFRVESALGTGLAAYMGIDGVRMRPVPAPAGAVLLGVVGLVAMRRHR